MENLIENEIHNLVVGRVTDQHNHPLPHLIIQVYDRDMRKEELLAETLTDQEGNYKVIWTHSQLSGRGKKEADLSIKVFTKQKKTLLYATDTESIRFNASPREEINIVLSNVPGPEMVEFDFLMKEVTFLAHQVPVAQLQENKEYQDVTFISRETDIQSEKIEHLILAHRLQEQSQIQAPFFYALLRKETLLKNEFATSMKMRLSITINSQLQTLLYDAALTDPKVIYEDVQSAVKEMIVGQEVLQEVGRNIEMLQQYKDRANEYYQKEYPERVLNTFTRFVTEGKVKEAGKLFEENQDNVNSFFEKILDPSFFHLNGKASALGNKELGSMLGFGRELIPGLMRSKNINSEADVKRLARLTKSDWVEELTKAKNGELNHDQKASINLMASTIVRKMEKIFPTTAFTAQLEREKNPMMKSHDKILSFLSAHDDFDLTKDPVDVYLKNKNVTSYVEENVKEELKSIQRVFKLVPQYRKTNALLNENIHSAQGIVAAGRTRFVKEIAPKVGLEEKEAEEIFKRAERVNTGAMLIVGELQDTIRGMDIASLETSDLALKVEAVSKDFPNLKTLFKLTDICACEHCRSVYSPAAYLVEILQFLEKRSVTDLTVTPPVTSNLAKDVLFERRPDLGDIDLGCENANTPVKYIDLVCEVLEEAVAPDLGISYSGPLSNGADPLKGTISANLLATLLTASLPVTDQAQIFETEVATGSAATSPHYLRDKKVVCKIVNDGADYKVFRLRQTFSSAAELAAAPEYVNANAYNLLQNSSYAFKLPFDLNQVEAGAYFNRFGIKRSELMKQFKLGGDAYDPAIASEVLGLTQAESLMIVTPKPTMSDQQTVWNAPSQWDNPPVSGNVVDYMKRVDHFLYKTGLTYKELDLMLTLKFIDPSDNLFIKNLDLTCDCEQKEIANLDEAALDRIHRFLRFQKKTGWKFEVLDEIISQPKLGNGKLDANDDNGDGITNGYECLIKAAYLKDIAESTGIKVEELIGFYGEIPHKIANDETPKPLYHQVFLNKAKNGVIDEALFPEKINGTQLISALKTSISVCLQLSLKDLDKLLHLLPDDQLTFENLSYLYGASRLIKKLKLKADDFVVLTELTALTIDTRPESTMDFVKAVEGFKNSPLKALDVKYTLRHQALVFPDLDGKATQILQKLQADYQNNFIINRSKYDPNLSTEEQIEFLQNELSRLSGVDEDDVKTFIEFIDKIWSSAADAKAFVDKKLAPLFDTTEIKSRIDELESVAATKDQDILDHENALEDLRAAQDDLKKATTPADIATATAAVAAAEAQLLITTPKYKVASGNNLLKAFLDSTALFQLEMGKQMILETTASSSFKTDMDFIKVVLKYAELKQIAPGNKLLANILESDALIDTDVTHTEPVLPAINNTTFSDQFAAIKLLNKVLALVKAFNLTNEHIEWIFRNSKDLGWFEWDSIPFEPTGHVPASYDKYIAIADAIVLSKELVPVANPADAASPVSFISTFSLLLTGGATTRSQFIEALSLLTGFDQEDIDDIDAYFFPVFNINNYRDIKNCQRLIDCAESLSKLGSTLDQVKEYLKPVLTSAEVSSLRVALKSRYDEDTWLETLKEIMDTIRPQKRNALVAYLLATYPDLKDENDLFDYFLVDVEMEACMPSSRIVQAHGTVQLFVQRCLMGLEPKASADLDNDANWSQWKWMKNYRVWEANRKVFLYPENWIEPELRDDKSFLFTELENDLQQSELTDVSAEEALTRYLEKLDNIAFLEVMATWYQVDIKTMHVFARTKGGDPATYYYRRFEQERYWTPWEKVDQDITGNQLLAYVRNNRLCLAWPVYSELPDPDQGATLPNQSLTTEQSVDKPRRKLKIQLAISEYSNKKWQPKKISQEGIETPNTYTNAELKRDLYNMMYVERFQQIWFFSNTEVRSIEYNVLHGVFNIAGCKGYPELLSTTLQLLPGFYPDFKDSALKSQRYFEANQIPADELAVRNGVSLFNFYEILNQTPGNFRLSYPHQFTNIDLIVLLFEYFSLLIGNNNSASVNRKNGFKLPLGTMLPYFKEDSKHAYVIIPGFYKALKGRDDNEREYRLVDIEKRTASDVFQLLEDISNFGNKLKLKYETTPVPDFDTLIHDILIDPDFQDILTELSSYEGFDNFYNFLIGINPNPDLDAVLEKLRDTKGLVYGEQFKNMYHPLVCSLRTTLYKYGIPELMKRETQLQKTPFDFNTHYKPNPAVVPQTVIADENGVKSLTWPIEDLDFSSDGSYSCYNWEMFYHVPLLLATRLSKNQRFEDALTWFHYIFNPTGALKGNTPQKYWVTKPFYLNQETDYINQRIDTLLYKIADPATPERKELEFAIDQWRNDPFKPDVVARFRPVAYQKAVLMKYIDNLTAWGDNLFRQDTMESIVQATQMYILADKLLGPKPRVIPSVVKPPYETYNQIKNKLDAFGNALIDLENILPDLSALPEDGAELPPPPITLSMLYFCIPQNDKMLSYWDLIADRLFKIRHCQNIDGIERSLALFAPPIDPALLVRAAASGLDISSVIAGLNAPLPYYKFNMLSQKSSELAQEVRVLGNALLAAMEKKDTESMGLLRSELEIKVLNSIKDLKTLQIQEAKEQIEILKKTRKVTEERDRYYTTIQKINSQEQLNFDKMDQAIGWQTAANITYALGAGLALIPDFALGVSGFGGSPHGAAKFGGSLLAHSTDALGKGLGIFSAIATYEANRASIMGGYERRFDDWKLQERLAKKELDAIDKQITAASIRQQIAETDLKNHEIQIDNAKKTEEFLLSKFTNKELYNWMIGQISSVYFSAYQLAHDYAKKAERSYRFELGNEDSFISYGYWDSMKKGLQSADRLIHDLKRMETNFMDKNKREFEITKHVSLAMLDPLALIRLRSTGVCDFEIPEALYDMDHPGQHFRRIKSVSVSLPCIAGPYTSVSAKLSLINNRYRKNTNADNAAGTGYEEDPGNDERFIYNVGAIQSIAASNSQNDSGIFELSFRDDRYLPFEGTGAVSSWRLELPSEIRQFDYNTISDVVVHIKYTAREGGSGLKNLANASLKDRLAKIKQQLSQEGLHIAVNLQHDLSNEWYLLKKNNTVNLKIDKSRFPYMAQTLDAAIEEVMFVGRIKNNPVSFTVDINAVPLNLSRIDDLKVCTGITSAIDLDTSFSLSVPAAQINNLEELVMVVKFNF